MESSRGSSDQEQYTDQSTQDWLFDAFSEPRTMPSGWDLSGMNGSRMLASGNGTAPAEDGQADESVEHEEVGMGMHIFYLNPFPEPRAYPVYWDLCR